MTTIKVLYEKFLAIEDELDLFSKRIDGIYFWERIRFEIFMNLVYTDAGVTNGPKPKKKSRPRYYLSSILNIRRNPFLARNKEILFIGTSRRVRRRDGFWWDIYIDDVLQSIENRYISLEYSTSRFTHYVPPKTKNIRYLDFIEFLSHIRQILGFAKIQLTKEHNELLSKIRLAIKREFGRDVNIHQRTKLMLKKRKGRLPLYTWLFRLYQPKAAVVAVGYGKEDIIEACKSLKIPVLELQHGVIHRYHLGYSFEGEKRKKLTAPDFLLTFGEYWTKCIEYPFSQDRIIPAGYPLMEEEQRKYNKAKKKKQIVFISQQLSGESISRFALELSKMEDNPYKIVFKLQPQECDTWREAYPWLIDADMEVIDERSDVLHKILAESEVQVGVSSTAIFEGMAFGLRTYLIDGAGVEIFEPLIEQGKVCKVESPTEMLEHLKMQKETTDFEIDYIFKRGAINTIVEFIKDFL